MVQVIPDYQMVVINVPAGSCHFPAVRLRDADFSAILNSELFLIIRRDKADAALGLGHVKLQPVAAIAVKVRVFAPVWIQPKHEGIGIRIRTESISPVGDLAVRLGIAAGCHVRTAVKNAVILRVTAQCVDSIIKERFEFVGVQMS